MKYTKVPTLPDSEREKSLTVDRVRKMQAARYYIQKNAPYLMPAIYSLIPFYAEPGTPLGDMVPTMGVDDKLRLVINGGFLDKLSHHEVASLLVHEISHALDGHDMLGERFLSAGVDGQDPTQRSHWNWAADIPINERISKMEKFPFPKIRHVLTEEEIREGRPLVEGKELDPEEPMCLTAEIFDFPENRTAEYYFARIREMHEQGKLTKPDQATTGPGAGECGGVAGNPNPGEEPGGQDRSDEVFGSGDTLDKDGQGDSQSGGQGEGQGNDRGQGNDGPPDSQAPTPQDVANEPGRSRAGVESIRKEVAREVQEHAAKHGCSGGIGDWNRWADDMLKPPKRSWKDDVRTETRQGVKRVRGNTFSNFSRYHRKQGGIGYGPGKPMMPRKFNVSPNIVIILDTSGSMGPDELANSVSETWAILKESRCNVTFMACDTQETKPIELKTLEDIKGMLIGGGGTDFRPPFEALKKHKIEADLVFFFTDGCGPAPASRPGPYETIFVLVGPHRQKPWKAAPSDMGYGGNNGEVDWARFIDLNMADG